MECLIVREAAQIDGPPRLLMRDHEMDSKGRSPSQGPPTKWLRRLSIAAIVMGLAWLLHAPLLRALAHVLVLEEIAPPAPAVVVLEEGDRRFEVAERLHHDQESKVLLYRRQLDRLERMGIRMPSDVIARRELRERGVPNDDVQSLPEVPRGRSQLVRVLNEWLNEHPDDSVDLLCDRFTSRTWKRVVARRVDAGAERRIHIVPLRQRAFDETNWWHCKEGRAGFVNGYLILVFQLFGGTEEPEGRERTAEDFAAAFRRKGSG
jgi:hypothetical protein